MPKLPKLPKFPKRRTKQEIASQLEQNTKVERSRVLARLIFPAIEQLETVYDGQTAFNAVSGHLKYGLIQAESKLKVRDLEIDLGKGEDSPMKHAVKNIIELIADEPAAELQRLIDLMGSKLPEFLAQKHLKDPMSTVTSEEFIAK